MTMVSRMRRYLGVFNEKRAWRQIVFWHRENQGKIREFLGNIFFITFLNSSRLPFSQLSLEIQIIRHERHVSQQIIRHGFIEQAACSLFILIHG